MHHRNCGAFPNFILFISDLSDQDICRAWLSDPVTARAAVTAQAAELSNNYY